MQKVHIHGEKVKLLSLVALALQYLHVAAFKCTCITVGAVWKCVKQCAFARCWVVERETVKGWQYFMKSRHAEVRPHLRSVECSCLYPVAVGHFHRVLFYFSLNQSNKDQQKCREEGHVGEADAYLLPPRQRHRHLLDHFDRVWNG